MLSNFLTLWYHEGSAYGTISPYGSIDSFISSTSLLGTGATVPDSACGFTTSWSLDFAAGGGVAGGVGGASCFLLSNDPICS